MAHYNIRDILLQVALNKLNNKTAKVLVYNFQNIIFSDKKAFLESIVRYYDIPIDEDSINVSSTDTNLPLLSVDAKDLRIKSLAIASVRGIPEKDSNDVVYGMNFMDDQTINNAIILANNGTGKSSIFSALEMIYTQEISERRLRKANNSNIRKEEYEEYLHRIPSTSSPYCIVDTPNSFLGFKNLPFTDNAIKIINPSRYFISDFDIYNYGQKDYDGDATNKDSFHSLIADSLGLRDIINFQSTLKETVSYRRSIESNNLKTLEKQKGDLERNIKNLIAEIQSKEIELNELRQMSNNILISNSAENKEKRIIALFDKRMSYELAGDQYSEATEKFITVYSKNNTIAQNPKTSLEKDFLAVGLEIIHDFDNCPFCQSSTDGRESIKAKVEHRLQLLQESQKLDEELKEHYQSLTYQLTTFYKETSSIYEIVNRERSELASFRELEEILEYENKLFVLLSPIVNDAELAEYIDKLFQKKYPNQDDYNNLYRLVNQNIIKYNSNIINDINKFLADRKKILQNIIESSENRGEQINISQQIAIIEEDIKRLNVQVRSSNDQIEKMQPQIGDLRKQIARITSIKEEIGDMLPLIDIEINKIVADSFEPIQESVESILKEYLKEDGFRLRIDKSESRIIVDEQEAINYTIVALIQCIDKDTGELKDVTPDIYFNAFRYKLFCLMVNISLAIAIRKKYNVNLPLVIDDIFFSSDFINKNSFSKFLQKLIHLFYKHTPDMPFQFILFTHDDLIFRSAIDAVDAFKNTAETIEMLCEENKHSLAEKTIIGRFFSPSDKESEPSEFSNGIKYWNLLYQIPKSIKNLISA